MRVLRGNEVVRRSRIGQDVFMQGQENAVLRSVHDLSDERSPDRVFVPRIAFAGWQEKGHPCNEHEQHATVSAMALINVMPICSADHRLSYIRAGYSEGATPNDGLQSRAVNSSLMSVHRPRRHI